jgi:hypothetical protein
MILAEVISCPLLPSAGDDLINNLKLLTDDCELAAEYAQSERLRLRLRAVCREWKSILESFSHRFVIITNDAHPPPLASRVQYPATVYECECRLPGCSLKYSPQSPGSGKPIQAYIDISPTPERRLLDIINQHQTLRLLATSIDLSSQDTPFSLSALSHACQGLTHLSLSELYIPNGPRDQTLDLPNLHTLTLSFYCPAQSASPGSGQAITHPSFQKWNFPTLRNLGLKGCVWSSDPSFFRQINALLRMVGPNLRGLLYNLWVLSPTEGDAPHPIPPALWRWCPKLHTIQVSLKILFTGPRPSRTHPRLTIVPTYVGNLDSLPHLGPLLWSPELFEQLSGHEEWPISRLCISTSWSTFYRKLRSLHETRGEEGEDSSYWPKFFCKWVDLLLSKNYAVEDRYGTAIGATDGLLTWLGNFREIRH